MRPKSEFQHLFYIKPHIVCIQPRSDFQHLFSIKPRVMCVNV